MRHGVGRRLVRHGMVWLSRRAVVEPSRSKRDVWPVDNKSREPVFDCVSYCFLTGSHCCQAKHNTAYMHMSTAARLRGTTHG